MRLRFHGSIYSPRSTCTNLRYKFLMSRTRARVLKCVSLDDPVASFRARASVARNRQQWAVEAMTHWFCSLHLSQSV